MFCCVTVCNRNRWGGNCTLSLLFLKFVLTFPYCCLVTKVTTVTTTTITGFIEQSTRFRVTEPRDPPRLHQLPEFLGGLTHFPR